MNMTGDYGQDLKGQKDRELAAAWQAQRDSEGERWVAIQNFYDKEKAAIWANKDLGEAEKQTKTSLLQMTISQNQKALGEAIMQERKALPKEVLDWRMALMKCGSNRPKETKTDETDDRTGEGDDRTGEGFVIVHTKDLTVVHMRGMFKYPENGLLPRFPAWPTWEAANREFQLQKDGQTAMGIDFAYAIVPVSVLRVFKISAKD